MPRTNPALYGAVMSPAVGLVAAGVAGLGGQSIPAAAAAAAGAAAALPFGLAARRAHARGLVEENTLSALAIPLGMRAVPKGRVAFRSWRQDTGWWERLITAEPGLPARIRVRYPRGADDSDPAWVGGITTVLRRELGGRYRVLKHDRRRKRIDLAFDLSQSAVAEVPKVQEVLQELLGAVEVTVEEDDKGLTRVEVAGLPATKLAQGNRRRGVEKILASRIPDRLRADWDLTKEKVVFSRRPEFKSLVHPPAEHTPLSVEHSRYWELAVPVGVDENGHTLVWHPRKMAHMLVVGGTGTGKTVVLHNCTQRLAQAGVRVWVIDGKRVEFIGFRDWPNVEIVTARIEHQIRLLHAAHELMMERYGQREAGLARPSDWEPLFLVIDEVTTFLFNADAWWKAVKPKGAPARAPFLDKLADLLRLARTAKIHILVGMQRPDASIISGEARDNFGFRMSLGRLSPQGAMMMWDNAAVGVAIPRDAKGRAMASSPGGTIAEIQTFFAPNPDPDLDDFDEEAVDAARPAERLYERRMLEILEEEIDHETGEPAPPTLEDYLGARFMPYDEDYIRSHAPAASATSTILAPAIGQSENAGSLPAVKSTPPPATAASDVDDDIDEFDEASEDFEGYEQPEQVPAGSLSAGDLVLLDEGAGEWAVVEAVEEDFTDDTQLLVDVRGLISGAPDTVSLPNDDYYTVRRPADD